MKQTQLVSCQRVEDGLPQDDINVTLTIHEIPAFLVKEFAEKIAIPYYTGGIAEAIKELMCEAVQSQKLEHVKEIDRSCGRKEVRSDELGRVF